MLKKKTKIIVIVGPTASGKSDLAVWLAKKFNGEVISADSRQVYKGMDIGTGKITRKEMLGIPHYLLDVANPKRRFSVEKFQKLAKKYISNIVKKEKLPIVCGGTGFYIRSIIDDLKIPKVRPNIKLRKELEKKSTNELCDILKKLDKRIFKNIDKKNRVRLIRAIEIANELGSVPKLELKPAKEYEVLEIGLLVDQDKLKDKIVVRLQKRLKQGMIQEVRNLRNSGLSWKKLFEFGLEYRFISLYLQQKISKDQMIDQLSKAIYQYAKRQMTWFKKDKRIVWIKPEERGEAEKIVKSFLIN